MLQKPSKNIVFFASGSGSNVENIANYFFERKDVHIQGVMCNNPSAGVIERCNRLKIPLYCFNRSAYNKPNGILALLNALKPDLIVLAGFLWKVPEALTKSFQNKIINIHPALLPKFGGKGMYGMHVHEAVVNAKEEESGITIHFVNEVYDDGEVIFQKKVALLPTDRPEDVAAKIHELEYKHFPEVIDRLLLA
jgi:phosphoribosylglycinamide formyltransferase-1